MPTVQGAQYAKLIIATLVFLLAGLSASYARGGMHGGGMGMRGGEMQGLMAPANPTVPPSLDAIPASPGPHRFRRIISQHRLTFLLPDAMLKPTPEEAAVDRAIGNICRGC